MPSPTVTLPFVLERSSDEVAPGVYRSTTETARGLLRLEPDRLVIQWRTHRETAEMGSGCSQREEVEPVRELSIPVEQLDRAEFVHRRRWLGGAPRVILLANDLRAFDGVAGRDGLDLAHPSRLELPIARADAATGREFVAELAMAISERQLRLAEERSRGSLPPTT